MSRLSAGTITDRFILFHRSGDRARSLVFQASEGVCLFPEATRTIDGRIASFKGGFTLLCRRGNAPVVPVLIDGAFECWPRHRKLFKPGSKISVTYGNPISVEQITAMEDDDFARLLTDTLRNMQSQTRLKNAKQPFNYS